MRIHQLPGVFRGRIAEDQNRRLDPCPAQLQCLIQAGHRQIVRPQFRQLLRHRHRAVSIGVGFDQTDEFALGRQRTQRVVVVGQPPQMDLRPGSLLQIIHLCQPSIPEYQMYR